MASTLFTGPEVSVSNLATLPTWMGLRTVQRVQKTVKRTAARFEPRFITRAVSKSQAGYQDVTLVEGVLAFSHAAVSKVNSFSENLLQYGHDLFTPALVVSAVQQDIRITALEKEVVTGRTQAILAVAVLHKKLQHQTTYGRHRLGAAIHTQSPSLVVGAANPLFSDAATSLASVPSSSAQAQSMPDEASQSPDQCHHPMQSMLTDNDLYDLAPPASAEAHEDSASIGSFSPTKSFCLPAVLPSSPVESTSTDAQMESSVQTIHDDSCQNDAHAPAFVDRIGPFGIFRPHANVPNFQSGSDRSDAQESSSTKSSASPRSILPSLNCSVPKLPLLYIATDAIPNPAADPLMPDISSPKLQNSPSPIFALCIATNAVPNPAADPPVPDISSPKLQESPPPMSSLSPLTTYTQAAHTTPSSIVGKPPQTQQKRTSRVAPVQKVSTTSVTSASISPAPQPGRRVQRSAPSPKTNRPGWK